MITIEDILKLIYEHDGQWSWYQLERAINPVEMPPKTSLRDVIRQLLSDELIVELLSAPSPRYGVTDAGRERLGVSTEQSATVRQLRLRGSHK